MISIAVFDVSLAFGGPEEGGWWYEAGSRAEEPDLIAMGKLVADQEEAKAVRDSIQEVLDRDWNTGSRKYDLNSTISAGKYLALIHDGWPPARYPEVRPRYE